jgi:Ubiquitin family
MTEINIKLHRVGQPPSSARNIRFDKTEKVTELKQGICYTFEEFGAVDQEQLLLVHYKEILVDERSLDSYGIGDGSKIQLSEYNEPFKYSL